jgi:hypothetical protein
MQISVTGERAMNAETSWEKQLLLNPSLICLDMCNLQLMEVGE